MDNVCLPEKIVIYFHSNGEDVGAIYNNNTIKYIKNQLKDNFNLKVLAVEYPGYGFYSHQI